MLALLGTVRATPTASEHCEELTAPRSRPSICPCLRGVARTEGLFILRKSLIRDTVLVKYIGIKMKKITSLLFGTVLALTIFVGFAAPVAAQTDQKTVLCGADQVPDGVAINGSNCIDKGSTVDNNIIIVWLSSIIIFLTVGIGVAATGGVVYGGFLYLTAQGNFGETQKGVATIINALIGVLLYALAFAIINFLV